MAAGKALTPSDYIQHHLTFLSKPVGDGAFWMLNVDSLVTSIVLGCIGLGLIWWVVKGATSGVPNRRQAFVELLIQFVDNQVKGIFHHGDRNRFIAPAALTVFVWVLLMNAMDFVPVDLFMGLIGVVGVRDWRPVPTADLNTTFALSISVLLLSLYFSVAVKGLGGWIHEICCAPFGAHPLLWPANLLLNLVEYISKTLSHSLRLFGNIYAGEIIFFLLWVWAATGLLGTFFGFFFGLGWMIFHILIVVLQAYIFMMLTIVYISMAHEHH
ncbi:MAG: F0F1 ATP synthase subunit A [Betaproteobacteria bacterium]|nr:F0F1 ATP synthase subunit A [Betaproteobacteria bacterium]MDH3436088.1 F0F1 ATP synthase subunit A [Betaproteobacteria bacterium]